MLKLIPHRFVETKLKFNPFSRLIYLFYSRETGILSISPDPEYIENMIHSLKDSRLSYEMLTNEDIKKRYPMLTLPPTATAILAKQAGVIFANKALTAFQVSEERSENKSVKNKGNINCKFSLMFHNFGIFTMTNIRLH